MTHRPTTDNTQLIYSIIDAAKRIETMLDEHEVDELAPGPNQMLEELDSQIWDVHDAMEDLL